METAFKPVEIEDYVEPRSFSLLGRIEEVLCSNPVGAHPGGL